MRVRDLERLLTEYGAGAAKLDAITRRLRDLGRLPTGGRGPNAPHIGAVEAAVILIALAGSSKGPEADLRLKKLEVLPSVSRKDGGTLLKRLTGLLEDPAALSDLIEVRVGRTSRRATFVSEGGRVEEFRGGKDESSTLARFHIEGILPASLLRVVAKALREHAE